MLIFAFFGLLAAVGIGFIGYACINLVKTERTLYKVKKRRELSKIETLKEIEATCKRYKNDASQYVQLTNELRAIRAYIRRYY
jgi:hypothetical protein